MGVVWTSARMRRVCLLAALALLSAGGALFLSQAHADAVQVAQFSCVKQSNGQMRHVTNPASCTNNEEVVSLHGSTPVYVCVKQSNNSMRRAAGPSSCGAGEFLVTLNAGVTVFACAQQGNGQLSYATSPAQCTGNDIALQINPGPAQAVDDAYNALGGAPLVVPANQGLLSNDGGGELTVSNVNTAGLQGSVAVNPDGSFTYTAPGSFTSPLVTTFQYTATNNGGSSTATVTLTVYKTPVANDDNVLATKGQPLTVPAPGVLDNDAANGASISAFSAVGSQGGSLALTQDGGFTYTQPSAAFVGVETFTYTLSNLAGSDSATITIQVGAPPDAVDDAVNATGNVLIDTAGLLTVFDNDDANSASISAYDATSAAGGQVVLDADGTFTYNPPAGFEGADSFQYTLTNALGSDTATVNVSVSDVVWFVDASAPAGGDGRLSAPFNGLATFNAQAADESGDIIYLYTAGGAATPYTGGVTLPNDEKLIGQGVDLTNAADITFAQGSVNLPVASLTGAPVLTNAGGAGVTLGQDNTLRGFVVGDTSGPGVSGDGFGLLTLNNVSVSGAGQALDLRNGNVAATFDSLSSSNSAAEGVRLDNLTGTLSSLGGVTVTNPAAAGVSLTNDASVDLGALSVTTSGQTGLLASGPGTLTIASGTLVTTGQPAVDVSGLNLAATLTSVSTDGGAVGLRLVNTTGSFTTTGAGATDGSGGVLQHLTDDGVRLDNAANVSLANLQINAVATTDGPSCSAADNSGCSGGVDIAGGAAIALTNVDISGSGQLGVNAHGVAGLTLQGSSIVNAGNGPDESGLRLDDATGAVVIDTTTVSGSADRNALVQSATGTLDLTVSASTFSATNAATGGDGFDLRASGDANLTTTLSGSTFTQNRLDGFSFDLSGAATVNLTLDGATVQSNNLGVNMTLAGSGSLDFAITNSSFSSETSSPINVFTSPTDTPTVRGAVDDNTIVGRGATANAIGVRVDHNASSQMTLRINHNSITNIGFFNGILARASGTGQLDLTLTNNTVRTVNPTFPGTHAVQLEARDTSAVCVNLSGNDAATANAATFGYLLRQRDGSSFALQGFAGNGLDPAAVIAYITATNTGSANATIDGGGFTNGVCGTP